MSEENTKEQSHTWLWAVLGVAILAAGGGFYYWMIVSGQAQAQPPSTPVAPLVRVAEVAALDRYEIRQTGFVQPRFAVDVAPDVGGRIVTVHDAFLLGAQVPQGTPLISLRKTRFEANLSQAEAAVDQGRAAVAQASASFDRQSQLADSNFASQARLDEARVGREQADAQLALAEANLRQAQLDLEDTVVTAPYDALVIAENASVGQIIQPGVAVGRLVAASAVEISVGLTPSDIALIGDLGSLSGVTVDVFTADGSGAKLATGRVTALDPQIAQGTRTANVLIEVENPFAAEGRNLRLGELVEVVIAVQSGSGTYTVPAEAIKAANRLWEVGEDNTLTARNVTVLSRQGQAASVQSDDLDVGARVLITDLPAPFEGQNVRVNAQSQGGN